LPSAFTECLRKSGALLLLHGSQSQGKLLLLGERSLDSNKKYVEELKTTDGVSGAGGLIGDSFC
jgi:hypothetical protein